MSLVEMVGNLNLVRILTTGMRWVTLWIQPGNHTDIESLVIKPQKLLGSSTKQSAPLALA
jgi:hypothetical protein